MQKNVITLVISLIIGLISFFLGTNFGSNNSYRLTDFKISSNVTRTTPNGNKLVETNFDSAKSVAFFECYGSGSNTRQQIIEDMISYKTVILAPTGLDDEIKMIAVTENNETIELIVSRKILEQAIANGIAIKVDNCCSNTH